MIGAEWLAFGMPNNCSRPVDQQSAQISVATFANAKQQLFAAAGVLFWNQSKPCSQLPAVFELLGIPLLLLQ